MGWGFLGGGAELKGLRACFDNGCHSPIIDSQSMTGRMSRWQDRFASTSWMAGIM